jgi:Cofilin/tropomyosin-type actin-binding protein
VHEEGDDGVYGMKESLNDGKVLFGYLAVAMGSTLKLVYISYCGEGVTGMKKGLFNQQVQFVGQKVFHPYHVQINARNEDDIDEEQIGGVVKKGFGANFHKEYKDQTAVGEAEESSITYDTRDVDQSTENVVTGMGQFLSFCYPPFSLFFLSSREPRTPDFSLLLQVSTSSMRPTRAISRRRTNPT